MHVRNIMLSPVGTSILTNGLDDQENWRPPAGTANLQASQLSLEDKAAIDARIAEVRARVGDLTGASVVLPNLSAELNGINRYFADSDSRPTPTDQHYLIPSDTYVGDQAAQLVELVLRASGVTCVEIIRFKGLNTSSNRSFSRAVGDLSTWCGNVLPTRTDTSSRVVFCTAGGFKALVGYLTVLGMLHHAEISYVFETGEEGIRLPAYPLRFDETPFREHAVAFGRMEQGEELTTDEVSGIDGALLTEVGDDAYWMSDLASMYWGALKKEIYGERLLPWPNLEYRDPFVGGFEAQKDRNLRAAFQESLAKASVTLRSTRGWSSIGAAGLHYDRMEGMKSDEFARVDHFRPHENFRVLCGWDGARLVMLDLRSKNDFKSKYGGG
ncbi:MAG: CRISPR-associated family [Actinobacteria bacterium]|nr:MAG: CRISPR-associated family [Actinomycetota bacterium]